MGPETRGFLCSACCAFALGLPIHILAPEQKRSCGSTASCGDRGEPLSAIFKSGGTTR